MKGSIGGVKTSTIPMYISIITYYKHQLDYIIDVDSNKPIFYFIFRTMPSTNKLNIFRSNLSGVYGRPEDTNFVRERPPPEN